MKMTLLVVVVATAGLLGSCNTMIGVGRDMRILGEQMENSSNKARGQAPEGDVSGAPVY